MIHFRILRASTEQLAGLVPELGQLVIDSTAKKLYIGDGGQLGGHLVGMAEAAVNELLESNLQGFSIETVAGLSAALAGLAESTDLAQIQATLEGKVTQDDFDELSELVALKASKGDLESTASALADQSDLDDLSALVAQKVDAGYLDAPFAAKADQVAFDALSQEVAGKADQAAFDDAIARKAPVGSVPDLTTQLNGKARQTDVDALSATVGTKQDQAAFTTAANLRVNAADLYSQRNPNVIKSALLPASVDDVLEFSAKTGFPAAGEKGKIYIANDLAKIFRWSGSAYIELYNPQLQKFATQAQALALNDNTVLMTPLQVFNVLTMVGIQKDTDGKWSLIDEGVMAPTYDTNYLVVMDFESLKDLSTYKHNPQLAGTASLSTGRAKSGNQSMLSGEAGWLTLDTLSRLQAIGTGDYTIEFDHYVTSSVSNYMDIMYFVNAQGVGSILRIGDGGFGNRIQYGIQMGSLQTCYSGADTRSTLLGKWVKWAIQRKAGKLSLWKDGVKQTTRNNNYAGTAVTEIADTTNLSSITTFRLGNATTTARASNVANFDNLKVSKIARY